MPSGLGRHAFRRHRKVEPSWKKEVLENRGKRDETPSAIKGLLATPHAPTVLRQSKATVFTGATIKPRVLR